MWLEVSPIEHRRIWCSINIHRVSLLGFQVSKATKHAVQGEIKPDLRSQLGLHDSFQSAVCFLQVKKQTAGEKICGTWEHEPDLSHQQRGSFSALLEGLGFHIAGPQVKIFCGGTPSSLLWDRAKHLEVLELIMPWDGFETLLDTFWNICEHLYPRAWSWCLWLSEQK